MFGTLRKSPGERRISCKVYAELVYSVCFNGSVRKHIVFNRAFCCMKLFLLGGVICCVNKKYEVSTAIRSAVHVAVRISGKPGWNAAVYILSLAVCVAAGYFVNEFLNKGSSKISAKVFQVLKME